ncbi:MAG: hypothetical protein FD167_3302, partial [bacterium]
MVAVAPNEVNIANEIKEKTKMPIIFSDLDLSELMAL